DPGVDPVQGWTITWGDGTVDNLAGNPSTATHVYADGPASYTILASVTTDDGTFAGNSVAVSVQSLPPSLTVNGTAVAVNEGQTATNSGTFTDIGHDAVTLSASVGTVTANADGTWSWSYATTDGPDQSQTVTVKATDDDGASSTTTFALTVNDVPPTVGV